MQVLPAVFSQRRMQRTEKDHIAEWILSLPGGERLLQQRQSPPATLNPVAYFIPDASRDASAAQLLENRQISTPTFDAGVFSFECYSSLATEFDRNPVSYAVEINTNGTASCDGPDFMKNGGACKHIRAGLLKITQLRHDIPDIPLIFLPTSEQEARVLQSRLAFCAEHSDSVTLPPSKPIVVAAQKINEMLLAENGMAYESDDSSASDGISEQDDSESVATDASDDADELNVTNFVSPPLPVGNQS
ncbi:hypothetical protein C8J57DRAFT_1087616 [Mycena rebaudengoi]|nr:hypothetical protein C8J57DRAFT_1087616 [Mycena rebaudengoi]